MIPPLFLSEKAFPIHGNFKSNAFNPNRLGALEKLPEEVIRKIFEEFLSLQEKGSFLRVCSFSKIVLQGSWENIQKRYLLPIEAFGNLEMCKEILPMPQKLLEVFNGEDGHLYFPFLKASRFRHVADGKEEIFPATYQGIEKASRLRGGLGYDYITSNIISQEGPSELQEMRWILMTKAVLLGSRSRTYDSQVTFVQDWISENSSLREGFEIPEDPRDCIYGIFFQFCQDQTRLYSDNPSTYTRCQKVVDGYRVAFGGFDPSGLSVYFRPYGSPYDVIGVGVLRKF